MIIIVCKIFLLFMRLLRAPIAKNTHLLAGIYFIFLEKCPIPNMEGFQDQIWTSVKRSESNSQVRLF